MNRSPACAFVIGMVFAITGEALCQVYPNRPMRIVTSGLGGNTDVIARIVAQGIAMPLGQQVIVDNRPSVLVGEIVSQAAPDGYTLLVAGGTFMIGPLLEKTSYDPVADFVPVTLLVRSPNILVTHPLLPVKNVKELIALAKAKPGTLNYSSSGTGGASQLAMELFKSMAGRLNIVRVNYKSNGPATIDLISGYVQLTIASVGPMMPHVQSGKLKGLAVTSAEPSALAPGLPPIAATLPGYESVGMTGLFVPAKTPVAIVTRLNQETVRFLGRADVKEKFLREGADVVGSSSEAFAAAMKAEIARVGKVIKEAGIKVE